jgi:hypothetical protein
MRSKGVALTADGRAQRLTQRNSMTFLTTFDDEGVQCHFTLVIHLRIGPVTLLSAVSGDMTSEMWL